MERDSLKKNGFTLIELLVVISIIAVLSVVGVTTYMSVQSKARDSIRKSDLNKLATALELYFQKYGKYVVNSDKQDLTRCQNSLNNTFYDIIKDNMTDGNVPTDPSTKLAYCYISSPVLSNTGQAFRLFAHLENCDASGGNLCGYQNYNYSITSDNLTLANAPSDISASTSQITQTLDFTAEIIIPFGPIFSKPNYTLEALCQDISAGGGQASTVLEWVGGRSQTHSCGNQDTTASDPITIGKGYWILPVSTGPIQLTGGSTTNPSTITLALGWDTISFVTLPSAIPKASDLFQSINQQFTAYAVNELNSDGQTYTQYSLTCRIAGTVTVCGDFDLNAGTGYLIRTAGGTYTLPQGISNDIPPTPTPTTMPTPTPTPTPIPVKRVFITSTTYNGNLGGLAGADLTCTTLARNAGLGAATNWMAWLSDGTTDPASRFTTKNNGPYKLVDSNATTIASNWADLIDGTTPLAAAINVDQNGNPAQTRYVWTGTASDGSSTIYNCNNWNSTGDSVLGTIGGYNSTNLDWTQTSRTYCLSTTANHLYCFEQ